MTDAFQEEGRNEKSEMATNYGIGHEPSLNDIYFGLGGNGVKKNEHPYPNSSSASVFSHYRQSTFFNGLLCV